MGIRGIRPGRQLCHAVECLQQPADHQTDIVMSLGAQLVHPDHDTPERLLHLGNRTLGIRLSLAFEACLVLEEFFPVEIGEDGVRCRNPGRACADLQTCEGASCPQHAIRVFSVCRQLPHCQRPVWRHADTKRTRHLDPPAAHSRPATDRPGRAAAGR